MEKRLSVLVEREYGMHPLSLVQMPGGWCAAAYGLKAEQGDYFLKVYDKQRPSVGEWVGRMEAYMPAVLWLDGNTPLRDSMTCPLPTTSGAYKAEDDRCVYLLFPLIAGDTIGGSKLTVPQIRELAGIVATLHQYNGTIPVPTDPIRETFDTSFCIALQRILPCGNEGGPLSVLTPYARAIQKAIERLREAAAALQADPPPLALCHTDLHGWNLMQAEHLILVDWEGLSLAPVEADLFAFTQGFFFDYARDEFLKAYGSVVPYRTNGIAMGYYQLRRRLTDIRELSQSIAEDNLSEGLLREATRDLQRECVQLARLLDASEPA